MRDGAIGMNERPSSRTSLTHSFDGHWLCNTGQATVDAPRTILRLGTVSHIASPDPYTGARVVVLLSLACRRVRVWINEMRLPWSPYVIGLAP
jgi:hypothetical protein